MIVTRSLLRGVVCLALLTTAGCALRTGPGELFVADAADVPGPTCFSGQSLCAGACRTLASDNAHCGACGSACPAGQVCVAAACRVTCGPGTTNCGGACRDLASDNANCGACGRVCSSAAGQVCAAGRCVCDDPVRTFCAPLNRCIDTRADITNCGACGNVCASGQSCVSGVCALRCPSGQTVCAGTCRNFATDDAHCGACGRACAAGQACTAGACTGGTTSLAQRSCAAATDPGCGMVRVPGGTFTLGDGVAFGASPMRAGVTVSTFAIDRYEVTVARFRAWMTAGQPTPPPGSSINYRGVSMPFEGTVNTASDLNTFSSCNWGVAGRDNHPINCVNWASAQAFCVWDGNGAGRLPTEAEWEFAARGSDGHPWPWGPTDDPARSCDSRGMARARTCAEDSFASGESPFGARHMVGNVWEWCADWYANYNTTRAMCWPASLSPNPVCSDRAEIPGNRVIRGGSWDFTLAADLRAASRDGLTPAFRLHGFVGFRCARDTP